MDDDYRLVTKDATMLLAKAAELFVQDLVTQCGTMASYQKRKTLLVNDILSLAEHSDKFHFIKDSKLPSLNPTKNT